MEENNKSFIKNLFRWIFSIFFILLSVNSAFNNGWLGVLLFGISGLLLCPSIEKKLLQHIPNFPLHLKTIVVSITIILVFLSTCIEIETRKEEAKEEEALESLFDGKGQSMNSILEYYDELNNSISNSNKYMYSVASKKTYGTNSYNLIYIVSQGNKLIKTVQSEMYESIYSEIDIYKTFHPSYNIEKGEFIKYSTLDVLNTYSIKTTTDYRIRNMDKNISFNKNVDYITNYGYANYNSYITYLENDGYYISTKNDNAEEEIQKILDETDYSQYINDTNATEHTISFENYREIESICNHILEQINQDNTNNRISLYEIVHEKNRNIIFVKYVTDIGTSFSIRFNSNTNSLNGITISYDENDTIKEHIYLIDKTIRLSEFGISQTNISKIKTFTDNDKELVLTADKNEIKNSIGITYSSFTIDKK